MIKIRRLNYLHHLVNLDKQSMLYNFFIAHWKHPVKKDWTEQARSDLCLFGLPESLTFIENSSKSVFKNLVKSAAEKYEFKKLISEKSTKSKLKYTNYSEFKMQNYLNLNNFNSNIAISVFKWRTRMTSFGENFKCGSDQSQCPWCIDGHIDSQEMSFSCDTIKSLLHIEGSYSDLFNEHSIPRDIAYTAHRISNFRENHRKLSP